MNQQAQAQMATGPSKRWQGPWIQGVVWGLAALIWRLPFIFRYDLYFQTEGGAYYLMAKHILKGEFPVYLWEQDYNGTLPHFVAAAVMAVFGHSIVLASLVSAMTYAVAVALGVAYVHAYIGRKAALVAGAFAAVGVPYGLKYTTIPPGSGYDFSLLFPFLFFYLAMTIYRRGWSVWLSIIAGLLAGHCWYFCKHVLLSFATVGAVFLTDVAGRKRLTEFISSRWAALFGGAFLVGYLPEIVYKLSHTAEHELLGVASPGEIWRSVYWFCRVFPVYFDGDPLGRLPEGVHYLMHNSAENFPQSAMDFLCIFIAWTVAVLILKQLKASWREHNVPVLMLAAYPVVNVLATVLSHFAAGEYYAPKRYLYTSGIILLLWTGIKTREFWEKKQWVLVGFLVVLLPVSVVHQYELLQMPDELRDYRAVVRQLQENNLHYGVTFYSYAFTMTALSDEDVIFGVLDYHQHEPYERIVAQQDTLALVYPSGRLNVPDRASFYNRQFVRTGEPHQVGELSWVVYKLATY